MSNWFQRSFGYGLGASLGRALFGDAKRPTAEPPSGPVRAMTEAEIQEDERRFAEEERRLDEADARKSAARAGAR